MTKRTPASRKRLPLAIAIALFLCLCGRSLHAQEAAAYAVMDSASGHLLASSNPNRKLQDGALTDIATAVIVLDWLSVTRGDINQSVSIPPAALSTAQNPIGFQPGDSASMRDLLYAALMQSDDIAAYALADHVAEALPAGNGQSTPMQRFVAQMNALARNLGMKNTLFVNPTGREDNERKLPYSTATDLGRLAIYAMNRSQFRFYVSQKERQISIQHQMGGASQYVLQNTNDLLGIDAIDGVKTGTTRRAGPCVIVSSARAPESRQQGEQYFITPRRIVVVVLGAPARFDVAHQLLRSGWEAFDAWTAAGRPGAGKRG